MFDDVIVTSAVDFVDVSSAPCRSIVSA